MPLRVTDFPGTDSSVIKKIQASFIFIGIEDWDINSYPVQSPFHTDIFIHYGAVSSLVASPVDLTANPTLIPNVAEEVTNIFGAFTKAHAFCGFSSMSFVDAD